MSELFSVGTPVWVTSDPNHHYQEEGWAVVIQVDESDPSMPYEVQMEISGTEIWREASNVSLHRPIITYDPKGLPGLGNTVTDPARGKGTIINRADGRLKIRWDTSVVDWWYDAAMVDGAVSLSAIPTATSESPVESRGVDPKAQYGATKPSVALVPSIVEIVAALAAEDGAKKYGAYNYREGHPVSVLTYANAAKRHLQAFIDREDFTSDTGVPNLGGVVMCVAIILDIMSTGVGVDDRPPAGTASKVQDAGKEWKKAVAAGENPVEAAKRILGPALGVKS